MNVHPDVPETVDSKVLDFLQRKIAISSQKRFFLSPSGFPCSSGHFVKAFGSMGLQFHCVKEFFYATKNKSNGVYK